MYFYIYKTTNKVTGKCYIGAHQTEDLADGYLGSGTLLKRALKKYGPANFSKEILQQCASAAEMFEAERQLVTPEFVAQDGNYNLVPGGYGGFGYINQQGLQGFANRDHARSCRRLVDKLLETRGGQDWRKPIHQRATQTQKERCATKMAADPGFRAKVIASAENARRHAQSSAGRQKQKQALAAIQHQKGSANSQFGTCWISHPVGISSRCPRDALPAYIEQGWVKGRNLFATRK